MQHLRKLIILLALVLVAPLAMHSLRTADAQCPVNPDLVIVQNDQIVGEVYREDPDPSHYTEHWVLYDTYVYPNARNGLVTTLAPGKVHYDSLDDFLARVPWAKGYRHVVVDCDDGTVLPGR